MNFQYSLADVPCDGECSYECAVIDGEEQCYCPTGFELSMPGGTQCVGMKEFSQCQHLATCRELLYSLKYMPVLRVIYKPGHLVGAE